MCQDGAQPLPPNLVLFWCFLVVRSVLTTLPCQSETWVSWFRFVPKCKLAQQNVPVNQTFLDNRYCVWVCACVHVLYILLFVTTVLLRAGLGGCNILSQLLTHPSGVNSHTGPQASWGQGHACLVLCFSSSAWHRMCACTQLMCETETERKRRLPHISPACAWWQWDGHSIVFGWLWRAYHLIYAVPLNHNSTSIFVSLLFILCMPFTFFLACIIPLTC